MLKVNIDTSKVESTTRLQKIKNTQKEMVEVLNSSNFKNKVIAFKPSGELSKWKDMPINMIYEHIMSGSEVLSPEIDYELDIKIVPYFSMKRVIGYTYPSVSKIYFNTRYFDRRTTKLVGSNLIHEYGHKLGFKHDFRSTKRRRSSICYLLNKAYEQSYDEIYGLEKRSKVKVCTGWWIFKKCRWVYEK